MAEFAKQDVIDDQYYLSTGTHYDADKKFVSTVFGYHNKQIMWSKIYKKVFYKTMKEAEEGHKKLKQEYGN